MVYRYNKCSLDDCYTLVHPKNALDKTTLIQQEMGAKELKEEAGRGSEIFSTTKGDLGS